MLEGINGFLALITDNRHSITKRIGAITGIFVLVLLIDNLTGFTYYYEITHKLDGIEKIESLLKKDSINSLLRKDLQTMEMELVRRQNLPAIIWNYITLTPLDTIPRNETSVVYGRSALLQYATSSGILFAIATFVLFSFVFDGYYNLEKFLSTIVLFTSLLAVGAILNFILIKVPLLFSNALFNYSLNLLTQIATIRTIDRVILRVNSWWTQRQERRGQRPVG